MLLDIKKIFGTYDEPVTAALELDLSEEDFPGYTVPGTVEARITATLQGRMLEIALDITADVAFACARCLEERTRRFHVIKTYCVREADLSDPMRSLAYARRQAGRKRACVHRACARSAHRAALQRRLCRAVPGLRQPKTMLLQA